MELKYIRLLTVDNSMSRNSLTMCFRDNVHLLSFIKLVGQL
jgi:hypothetical protein